MKQFTIKLLLLLFTLYTVHSTLYITPAFASEDIGYSRISPASPLYFLKTIRESLELQFAGTDHVKSLRKMEFATRRLREARTLVAINQDLIVPTLERYISDISSMTQIQNDLTAHLKTLEQMYDQVSNLKARMAIRNTMNRIIQRSDAASSAKAPVCDLFFKEATSSSLNQTGQVVLAERAQKCLKTNK